jgi:hypothetical protein
VTYNTIQISKLDTKIENEKDLLIDITKLHQNHLHHLDEKADKMVGMLRRAVENVIDAVRTYIQDLLSS